MEGFPGFENPNEELPKSASPEAWDPHGTTPPPMTPEFGFVELPTAELRPSKEGPPFRAPLADTELSSKIKTLEGYEQAFVRIRVLTPGNEEAELQHYKKGQEMFKTLHDVYGIPIPNHRLVIGMKDGKKSVFNVVDKIDGKNLREPYPLPPEAREQCEQFFLGLVRYAKDLFQKGGAMWDDTSLLADQVMYGREKDGERDQLWVVDTDSIFQELDPGDFSVSGLLLNIYRLAEGTGFRFSPPNRFDQFRTELGNLTESILSQANDVEPSEKNASFLQSLGKLSQELLEDRGK